MKTENSGDRTNKLVALYLVSIGTAGAPSGEVYARMMNDRVDLGLHQALIAEFVRQNLVSISGHFLTLTEKGRQLHDEIAAILLAAKTA